MLFTRRRFYSPLWQWVILLGWFVASAELASAQSAIDPPAVQLVYTRGAGAETCQDEAALRENLAARLGHDPFVDAAPLEFRVVITRAATWQASLTLARGDEILGENISTSRSADCDALMPELELAMAIALDPVVLRTLPSQAEAVPAEAVPSVAVPPNEPAPPAQEMPLPVEPPTAPEPREPLHFRAGVALHVSFLSAPSAAFGLTFGAGVMAGTWSLSLEGRADFTASSDRQPGRVESSILSLAVVPCIHHRWFYGCASIAGGVLRAAGVDFVRPQRITTQTWAAGARVGIDAPLFGVLRLTGGVEVAATLTRTSLTKEDGSTLWSTPPVAFRVFLGPTGVF